MIEPFQHSSFKKHQENLLNQDDKEDYLRKKRSISYDLKPHLIYKANFQSFEKPINNNKNESIDINHDNDSYINNTEWIDIHRKFFWYFFSEFCKFKQKCSLLC